MAAVRLRMSTSVAVFRGSRMGVCALDAAPAGATVMLGAAPDVPPPLRRARRVSCAPVLVAELLGSMQVPGGAAVVPETAAVCPAVRRCAPAALDQAARCPCVCIWLNFRFPYVAVSVSVWVCVFERTHRGRAFGVEERVVRGSSTAAAADRLDSEVGVCVIALMRGCVCVCVSPS